MSSAQPGPTVTRQPYAQSGPRRIAWPCISRRDRRPAASYVRDVTPHVVRQTIDIAAPAEVVFDVLTNPAHHAEIDGSTTVRRFRHGSSRLTKGSTFSMSMRLFGVPYRVTNRVVEFEPNRLIAWRHFEPQRWRYELEPVAAGTRVTESFDYSYWSPIGRSFIRLLGWPGGNQRAIAATLHHLKAATEHQARPTR